MERNDVITMIEELLEVEAGTINPELALDDIEEWDSLSALSFVAEVMARYQKLLTVPSLRSCKTVGDLIDAVCND